MIYLITEEVCRCMTLAEAEEQVIKIRKRGIRKGALRIVIEVAKDEARRGVELPARRKK